MATFLYPLLFKFERLINFFFLSIATKTMRIPEVFHYGDLPGPPSGGALRGNGSFIVMENLNLKGASNSAELGKQLALMHLAEANVRFAQ